jgi:cytochrome c1
LAAGAAVNDEASLVEWLTDPDHIKPGARMPAMKLSDSQIARVAGYLSSLE